MVAMGQELGGGDVEGVLVASEAMVAAAAAGEVVAAMAGMGTVTGGADSWGA